MLEGRDAKGRLVKGHRLSVGNGGGRPPKELSLTYLLKKELKKNGVSQEIVKKILQLAKDGNVVTLLHIWDRVDGKVKDTLTLEGEHTVIHYHSNIPVSDDRTTSDQ